NTKDFYSFFISGAQRLPNGNTLICSGANGTLLEVTVEKDVVWKYLNPVKAGPGGPGGPPGGPLPVGGPPGGFGPPLPGQVLPAFLQDVLKLHGEQKQGLGAFQTEVSGKLDKVLTDEQKKQLKEPPGAGPGGFAGFPQPGQLMAPTLQARLKLTAEQKKQVTELQKEVDGRLDKLFSDE